MYIYIYIHTYVCVCVYIYIYTYIYIYMCVYMYTYLCMQHPSFPKTETKPPPSHFLCKLNSPLCLPLSDPCCYLTTLAS